jgi:hypothetical protein
VHTRLATRSRSSHRARTADLLARQITRYQAFCVPGGDLMAVKRKFPDGFYRGVGTSSSGRLLSIGAFAPDGATGRE